MTPHIDNALIVAATRYNTTIHAIQSGSRMREASAARRALLHVLVEDCKLTLQAAGQHVGCTDHTSVIYALKRPVDDDDRAAIRRAALAGQTTVEDCRAWLKDWPRIRSALRWHLSDNDAVQEALDDASAMDALRRMV